MDKNFPLAFLIDQAQEQVDAAAKALGLLNKEVSDAEQKLTLLLGYRQEYQNRLQESAKAGITPKAMHNFREFTKKLDMAVNEQQRIIEQTKARRLNGQNDWQEKQKKLKSYETLARRHELQQAKIQAKRDQNEMDEFASKSYQKKDF